MGDLDLLGKTFGNYRLIRLIGAGGFANVYEGEHIHLDTRAAVKFLAVATGMKQEEEKSFLKEAQIIASLIHPHIIRLLDYSVQDARPFLVMDYAPGGTLADLYAQGMILKFSQVVSYVKQVASALEYAHDHNVIHRDVKPNNMLVKEDGEILLSDFGIAVMNSTGSLNTGQSLAGTIRFMAPEQILGQPRRASDQYSLAICTYLWLCGTYPFQGSFTEMASKHLFMPPPPPSHLNPTVPTQVEQVLLKALAKKPEDRFQSVEEFTRSLEQASQSHNIIIPSYMQRLQEPSRPEKPNLIYTLGSDRPLPMPDNPPYGPLAAIPSNVPAIRDVASPILPATVLREVTSLIRPAPHLLAHISSYLIFVPLLTLLTPLLLLYYYITKALRKPSQVDDTVKRLNPLAAAVSSLPLPQGFWPARLLTGMPVSPLPSLPNEVIEDIGATFKTNTAIKDINSIITDKYFSRKESKPKAFWQQAVHFVVRGPATLQDQVQSVQPAYQQYVPYPKQEGEPTVISPSPQAPVRQQSSAFKHSPALEAGIINAGERKKICVLYHDNDRYWAEWIAWLLEEDGLSSIVPDWDFRAGYNVAKETRKAIDEAQQVIVIISPDYLDTHNTQWKIVFNQEMLNREGTVLPIIVRDCGMQLRKPLDTLVSINLVGRDILHTSEKLRKAVRLMRSKPSSPPMFPPDMPHLKTNTTGEQQAKRGPDTNGNQQKEATNGETRPSAPVTDPPITKRFDIASEATVSSPAQRAELIERAFDQKDWPDVIRKSKLLIQHSPPGSVAWKIYRMQALAYHAQGKMEEAHEALEIALALVSDKRERLALLDEYTNALSSLERWREMLVYTKEALTLAPNDIRWKALHDQITQRIDLEKLGKEEEQFPWRRAMDRTIRDQSEPETIRATDQPKDSDQRAGDLKELPFDQSMGDGEKTVLAPSMPITIFIAYSLDDRKLCTDLKNQLTSLAYQYQLVIRYDHDISAGKELLKSIEEYLRKAQIIILLLSSRFLSSDYHRWQVKLALERRQASATRVIPVLLRPSDWEETPLGGLQALPKGNGPITTWHDRDEAFLNVVQGIRQTVEELRSAFSA